jgi:hypothetical protein
MQSNIKRKEYKEANLRKEFLDWLFRDVLGWDLENKQGFPEQYKEVVVEDSLEIEGKKKEPDYCFRMASSDSDTRTEIAWTNLNSSMLLYSELLVS